MRKKIALIVQRYGLEVNGGAELHCRLLAEKLSDIYDVTILTSCALNYKDWANFYPAGETSVNNIRVLRFENQMVKNPSVERAAYRKLRKRKWYQKALKSIGLLSFFEAISPKNKLNINDFDVWLKEQGPYLPDLIGYLKQNTDFYHAFIFFTYLYYPTAKGIKVTPQKSILIPTAHDENAIYIPFFKDVFTAPRFIIYNTVSEKKFVTKLFHNEGIVSDIAGVGVNVPSDTEFIDIKSKYHIQGDYIVYIGRVEAGKGCKKLISYFSRYLEKENNLKLVLVGQVLMPLPRHESIISLGFVSEEVKVNVLKQAKALVIPSLYESLSMVTLEAMTAGIPVIANQKSEVLEQHIIKSEAGFLYHDFKGFKSSLLQLNNQVLLTQMAANGKRYVEQNYSWEKIVEIFEEKIEAL